MPRVVSPTQPTGGMSGRYADDIEGHPIWGADDADKETFGDAMKGPPKAACKWTGTNARVYARAASRYAGASPGSAPE